MIDGSNAIGHRCINSALVHISTKGHSGPILPMKVTNLQERKIVQNETYRVLIVKLTERYSDLGTQIIEI